MVTHVSSAGSDEAVEDEADHAIVVADGSGRVLHTGGDVVDLLGDQRIRDVGELADTLLPEDVHARVPHPGESGSLLVRHRRSGRRLALHSYPLTVDDAAPGELALTIFTLSEPGRATRDPAIDPGIAAVLSHELRTPITTIYAGSQMLLGRPRLSEESQREMLTDIQMEADRLYRLVEDLLVANVGQGRIDVVPEPVLLQRTLPRVVAMEAARWPQVKFVTTLARELPAVRADELYLEHIVRDLLANAGWFSDHQATVRVDARHADDWVEVRVLDEGPGLGDDGAEVLFLPFRGAEPEGGGRPGPGLGLYVCKLLVEAMGGRIWARARPTGGSEFGFSLPRYRDEQDDSAEADDISD